MLKNSMKSKLLIVHIKTHYVSDWDSCVQLCAKALATGYFTMPRNAAYLPQIMKYKCIIL